MNYIDTYIYFVLVSVHDHNIDLTNFHILIENGIISGFVTLLL